VTGEQPKSLPGTRRGRRSGPPIFSYRVDAHAIIRDTSFARIGALQDAVDAVMGTNKEQATFLRHAGDVWTLFKAVLPDPAADPFCVDAAVLHVMADKVRSLRPPAYDDAIWQTKATKTYEWVFEHYH
jgi:hypothetical protein